MALEQGLLFFLLPIAAFSGWLIGRRRPPSPTESDPGSLNRDYLRGMNYLLSEQPDKAIEVFIRLAAVDNDTFETHLALGALFRRRGEVDRAIRIHQNLIARPNLAQSQKAQALFELAQDYLKLGVLDRAEAILSELKNDARPPEGVLESLLHIYERERDWRGALATAHLMMARRNPMDRFQRACHSITVSWPNNCWTRVASARCVHCSRMRSGPMADACVPACWKRAWHCWSRIIERRCEVFYESLIKTCIFCPS